MQKSFLLKTFILLLCFATFVLSEGNKVIVTTDTWAPFRMHHNNIRTGIDYDLWKELSKRMQWDIEFQDYPWARSLGNMKIGAVDAMSGLAKRAEREKYITYTTPAYFQCSTVFYVRKGDANLIGLYDDLYHFRIGYVLQSAYFEAFDKDSTIKKVGVGSESKLITLLMAKRLHVFIGTDCQADYEIAKRGLNDKIEKAAYRPNNSVDLYIGFSKYSPYAKQIDTINQTIKEIVDEGKIKEFSNKYYK